jgi:hypothetical protein
MGFDPFGTITRLNEKTGGLSEEKPPVLGLRFVVKKISTVEAASQLF